MTMPPIPRATSDAVRRRMQRTRRTGTGPERALRTALRGLGMRPRVEFDPAVGTRTRADLAFIRARVLVFVDGCFWHGCPLHGRPILTNADYWSHKIATNRARDAKVIAVATEGDQAIASYADDVLFVPATHEALSPVLAVIPLQLFAYYTAIARGADVDQPRNLAKSVTVE